MALADGISFFAASGGVGGFVFGSARPSFLTPAQAVTLGELVDGQLVSYLAQDLTTNPTQREWGHGTFTAASSTIARTTVLGSVNAGVAGSGSPISFTTAPTVSLTLLKEDLLPVFTADPGIGANANGPPSGIIAGAANGTGAGGNAYLIGGSSPNGQGGRAGIYGGTSGNTTGNLQGKAFMAGGNAGPRPLSSGQSVAATVVCNGPPSTTVGGELGLYGGAGSNHGPFAYMYGGAATNGGNIAFFSGRASLSGSGGGSLNFGAGSGVGAGAGGFAQMYGGNGGATGKGGGVYLYSGNGGATSGNSGDVVLKIGTVVSGTRGNLKFKNIPTASAGLPAGSVWNNGGVLNIV